MSHTPSRKYTDDNECSGPRPPVPGEESRVKKMTEGVPECPKNSQPSYLNWAITLSNLLEDRDGVELFKKYVEEEVPIYNDHLNFYFACEGLKQQNDPEKIKQIIVAIYRFLRKTSLTISEDLRRTIKAGLKNELPLSSNIYDSLQQSTENTIREKIYPDFLGSDMYIQYVQQMSGLQERFLGSGPSGLVLLPNDSTMTFGASSAGALYGASASASSSGSGSATDTLPRSSTLPTLHEDTELAIGNEFENLRVSAAGSRMTSEMPMRLTHDLLLATQKRRLEIRPAGAHGYVYTATTSYNPNSRVDSERQSCSSGGRSNSDSMSKSKDGRPYVQDRHNANDSKIMRQNALANKEINDLQQIPRTLRLHSNEYRPLKEHELLKILIPKLEKVKRKQDLDEWSRSERLQDDQNSPAERLNAATDKVKDRALADAIREKLTPDDDNDQDILDQHVSRVWKDLTPHRSPGTMSPCPPLPTRRRTTTHDSGLFSDGAISIGAHSMRHSKSMPEHSSSSRRLTNKWPSMNTDRGISLFSADTLMKYKDSSSRSGSSTAAQLEEAKRRLEDETRRSRRISQHPPPPMPLPMQSISSSSSGSSSTQQPPPPHETTTVVFTFCDEEFPYRTKIPGSQPTLKQFKDYLPKKGNFRYFFKTHCEDPESPVIQEEIVNDSDILPLFKGKVSGLVKPSD